MDCSPEYSTPKWSINHFGDDGEPWFLAEVKTSETRVSAALGRFQAAVGAKHAFQIVFELPYEDADCFSRTDPVAVPARTFFSQLV